MQRYLPSRSFPSYAFIPGKNVHPNKEGGHSFAQEEICSGKLGLNNDDYLYAIDLINFKYYWEAHVYLEAIWNAHNRVGPEADFCKALIKMSASVIKFELNSETSAQGHLDRALEILNKLEVSDLDVGVTPKTLIKHCQSWKEKNFSTIELQLS